MIYKSESKAGTAQAKHGGQAVKAKYGPDHFARIGKQGGETVKQRQGADFYAKIGCIGNESTKRSHGFYISSRISKVGGQAGKRGSNEEPTRSAPPGGAYLVPPGRYPDGSDSGSLNGGGLVVA